MLNNVVSENSKQTMVSDFNINNAHYSEILIQAILILTSIV